VLCFLINGQPDTIDILLNGVRGFHLLTTAVKSDHCSRLNAKGTNIAYRLGQPYLGT
jgi:hypothetical protein